VRIVQERLEALGLFGGQKIRRPVAGAVGDTTASEATGVGFEVVHVASKPLGTVLAEELGHPTVRQNAFLLPRSDRANRRRTEKQHCVCVHRFQDHVAVICAFGNRSVRKRFL